MSVTTRVRVILDIETSSTWRDDTTISQVKKQSVEDANRILSVTVDTNNKIKMIGKVECVSVMMGGVE